MNKYAFEITRTVEILLILVVAVLLNVTTRRILRRYLLTTSAKLNVNPANYNMLKVFVSVFYFSIAFIIIFHILPGLEKIGSTLLASAGIISVLIGLAAQQVFGNIFSGLYIFFNKPYRVNDIVQLSNGNSGIVEDITLQNTVIRMPDSRRLIIPNSVISKDFVINANIKDEKMCNQLQVGIAYGANIAKARQLLQAMAEKHPSFIDVRDNLAKENGVPAVPVNVIKLDSSAVILQASVWCSHASLAFQMKCDLQENILKEFAQAGIEIPFNRQDIYLYNQQ